MGAWTFFTLGGYINKQNCRIWDSKNPQVIEERPLRPEKVTVCCALLFEDVIGPYFFKNDDRTTVTVNSERYGHMITDLFWLLLKNMIWRICSFNKTVPHATQLERRGISWPRNFSLWRYQLATMIMGFNTIRLFLCGYAKDRVYAD